MELRDLYRYDIYITGHLKNIQEFIMFISDTASMFILDYKYSANWVQNFQVYTTFKTNQITHSVEFNDCSLTSILEDDNRIPQSMGLSYLPTYRVVLRTYLPIRDDVMQHAKGIVDASRYAYAHRDYFRSTINNYYSVYNLYCDSISEALSMPAFWWFPIRPDFTLKQIYRRDKIFNKDRTYFKVGSSVFVHKIDFMLEPSGHINGEIFSEINPVKNDQFDYVMDCRAAIQASLDYAFELYCKIKCPNTCNTEYATSDCYVRPGLYNDFIKAIYTANLRSETPNTYTNGRRDSLGDGNDSSAECDYVRDNTLFRSMYYLQNIRISKNYVSNLYDARMYAYMYYVNIKKYAIECFLSNITDYVQR